MNNNANLVKALVNNSWSKQPITREQAIKYLAEKEYLLQQIAYHNRKAELHINIPKIRNYHIDMSGIFQDDLIMLQERFEQ